MITIVGIGADGWEGLSAASRAAIEGASTVMGSERQLALIPSSLGARRELLPSPLLPSIDDLAGRDSLCLLASGDPMLHGIGATLARALPASALRVLPAVSSVSLAAARLGWPLAEVTIRSMLTESTSALAPDLVAGRRLLVLARNGGTAEQVGSHLRWAGLSASRIHVCADLGSREESITIWEPGQPATSDLVVLGVECLSDHSGRDRLTRLAGLPDDAYHHDGALTRREVRALVLAHLAPRPGDLLWDIGAGSGSIAIEWLRAEPLARAVAVEPKNHRLDNIRNNSVALGVQARLKEIPGECPSVTDTLPKPQAVFIGGGLTTTGCVEACWDALATGGRLVATAVTIESEALMHSWAGRVGGTLTRLELSRAAALGSFTTWRPELPIVVWAVVKP